MKAKRTPKSAAELMAELERDPAFAARQAERARLQARNADAYRRGAEGVLAELRGAGFAVNTVSDLVRLGKPYPAAVPILVRWLSKAQEPAVKEDIVRSLTVPWAASAAPRLIEQFERVEDDTGAGLRWAIGNALEVLANDQIADDLLRVATDRRFGKARQMIVVGLGKLRSPRVTHALVNLLSDDDVAGHALIALQAVGARVRRSLIAPLLNHEQPWVRIEAQKALSSIGDED